MKKQVFIALLAAIVTTSTAHAAGEEYEVVLTHRNQRHNFLSKVMTAVETGEKIGGYKIKECGWDPSLFIDTYYDTYDYSIYENNSALRARMRFKDLTENQLRDAFLEGKVNARSSVDGAFLNEEQQGKKFSNLSEFNNYLRSSLKHDEATKAVLTSVSRSGYAVRPIVEVRNNRTFLCAYKKSALNSLFIPKFAITLDDISIKNKLNNYQSFKYYEMEIQIFNRIPLITGITDSRIEKAKNLAEAFKRRFGLIESDFSKYKKAVEYFNLR